MISSELGERRMRSCTWPCEARSARSRAKTSISLLDGDNQDLALKMRQHGNFIENIPIAVILMAIAELQGAGSTWLHAIGILLIAGRAIHPFGLNFEKGATAMRVIGTTMTTVAMLISAYLIIWPLLSG